MPIRAAGPPSRNLSHPKGDLNERARAAVAADASLTALVASATPQLAGKKVLLIGDSHSVGAFGERMDVLLRAAGASTRSYGMAGSSPSWWVSGRTGAAGKAIREKTERIDDGKPWNTPRPTPKLAELIQAERPEVLVVAMGANFRTARADVIAAEVAVVTQQAKAAGARLIWVGPPKSRDDDGDPKRLADFNKAMAKVLGSDGTYIPSSPHTPQYEGGDGLHYTGPEGTKLANRWAAGVFSDLSNALR